MSFDTDAIVTRVRREAARRLLAAAITLQSSYRADVSVGNPAPHDHPAPKGQFPKLRTGQGRSGVSVWPASVAEVELRGSVSVGFRPPIHLFILGNKGWRGMLDSYRRERSRLLALLQGNGTP